MDSMQSSGGMDQQDGQQAQGGYCIEIYVGADGRPTSVNVETMDDESAEDQIMGGTGTGSGFGGAGGSGGSNGGSTGGGGGGYSGAGAAGSGVGSGSSNANSSASGGGGAAAGSSSGSDKGVPVASLEEVFSMVKQIVQGQGKMPEGGPDDRESIARKVFGDQIVDKQMPGELNRKGRSGY